MKVPVAVTVRGVGLSCSSSCVGVVRCRVGSSEVAAVRVSDGAVVCNVTASWSLVVGCAGGWWVWVSVGGVGGAWSSVVSRHEVVRSWWSGVRPWSSSEVGGSVVTVGGGVGGGVGGWSGCGASLRCVFGVGWWWWVVSSASVHGGSSARCSSASVGWSGWGSVEVCALGGCGGFGVVGASGGSGVCGVPVWSGVVFVHLRVWVSGVSPSAGWVEGGTRVWVWGSRVRETSTVRCRLGVGFKKRRGTPGFHTLLDEDGLLEAGLNEIFLYERTLVIISSDFCHWGDNFDYKPLLEGFDKT